MRYLDLPQRFDSSTIPLGATFHCLFAPDETLAQCWQLVTFEAVMHEHRIGKETKWLRGYAEVETVTLPADEGARMMSEGV